MLSGMLRIGEALRLLVPCFTPREPVRRALDEALGCALAEDVLAPYDLPRFDDSAMDGYAVRFTDLSVGRALPLHGESRAGGGDPGALSEGSAMRIFTGAPLPVGADTVVIQEDAVAQAGGSVAFSELPARGANVRARGSDLKAGARTLAAGCALGPGELGLLASLGCAEVAVRRPPRVAIISVGDELRELGEALSPYEIVNSNAHYLAARVRALGAEPLVQRIARDQLGDIVAVLEQAMQRADVVLSSGGVSVGDYDHVAEACARAGVERRFAKVAIKPGKPLWLGMRGELPVVGLPGNPVSTLVTFEVFVRPGLRRMLGHAAPYPSLVAVTLTHAHRHGTGRPELARAALDVGPGGELRARLHARQGSGSLPSIAGADALVLLDGELERFEAGVRLPALLLEGGPHQQEPAFP